MGLTEFQEAWVSKDKQSVIEAACVQVGMNFLKPVKDALPPEITYDEIKLVVGRLRSLNKSGAA
jgi:uncharacterized protein YpbB